MPGILLLFTGGDAHRRSFGYYDWENNEILGRIELEGTTGELEALLRGIDHAPDGCGHFDWEAADLVNKSGQRYHIGDYESIAGIYWLAPDDKLNFDDLSPDPEPIVYNDTQYIPPRPRPNCEYFTEEYQNERKRDIEAVECGCRKRFDNYDMEKCSPEIYERYDKKFRDSYPEEDDHFPDDDCDTEWFRKSHEERCDARYN